MRRHKTPRSLAWSAITQRRNIRKEIVFGKSSGMQNYGLRRTILASEHVALTLEMELSNPQHLLLASTWELQSSHPNIEGRITLICESLMGHQAIGAAAEMMITGGCWRRDVHCGNPPYQDHLCKWLTMLKKKTSSILSSKLTTHRPNRTNRLKWRRSKPGIGRLKRGDFFGQSFSDGT